MALTRDERTFNYGSAIKNCYIRIVSIVHDVTNKTWKVVLKYYLNQEARDTEKLSAYLVGLYTSTPDIAVPQNNYTTEQWQKVYTLCQLAGKVNTLAQVEYGISDSIWEATSGSEDDIKAEIYRHAKLNLCSGAVDVIVDKSIETLLEEYVTN